MAKKRIIVTGDEADFGPPPAEGPSFARKLLDDAGAMGGSALGSLAGAPLGPAGMVAGAALGGAGGKAWQRVGEYLSGARDPSRDTAGGNAQEIGLTGLTEGAGQAAMGGLASLAPAARQLGAGAMKIAAGIPEKYGLAVLKDPSILRRAAPLEDVGRSYDAFEGYTGLKGLQRTLTGQGRATAPTNELERMVIGPANELAAGRAVDPQTLYTASQAASRLKLAAKYGEPQAQMAAASGAIGQGKRVAEEALEKSFPEYGPLRKSHFEAKARQALEQLLPLNKGGTTNILRPAAATSAAVGTAYATEDAKPLAALALLSPKTWGTAIRAGAAASPVARFLSRWGTRAAAAEAAKKEGELP